MAAFIEMESEGVMMKIAVTGKMRSGKDTFANVLIDQYHFEEFKFSTGITATMRLLFPEALLLGKQREYYQTIGQSMRGLESEVWIKYTHRLIEARKDKGNVIITDLRQSNEAEYLRRNGYTIVKIEAPKETRIHRIQSSGDIFSMDMLNHETELSVDDIKADYTITNNKTIPSLELEAVKLICSLSK